MNKFKFFRFVLFILGIFVIFIGIFLPEYILNKKSETNLNKITLAKESYYKESGAAMARNTSSNLSALERINLTSDTWDSNMVQCDKSEGFLSEAEAIALARTQLDHYYKGNIYPYSLSSTYNNWYSWDTSLYCCTDTVFNTYSAYLWVIKFTKFDNSLSHTLVMTESGTILLAETSDTHYIAGALRNIYHNTSTPEIIGDKNVSLVSKYELTDTSKITNIYPNVSDKPKEITDAYILTLSDDNNSEETYVFYQYKNEEVYGISLIPYTP